MKFLPQVTKLKINKKIDNHFTPMTINLGEIKGGDAPNIVPSYCEATVDIRYPIGIKKTDIIKKIESLISSFNKKNRGAKITLKDTLQDTYPHLLNKRLYLLANARTSNNIAPARKPKNWSAAGLTIKFITNAIHPTIVAVPNFRDHQIARIKEAKPIRSHAKGRWNI